MGGGVGGVATILGMGLGWLGAGLESALLSVGWFTGMTALTRSIYSGVARNKHKDLEALSDRIADIVTESARDRLDDGQTTTRALPS